MSNADDRCPAEFDECISCYLHYHTGQPYTCDHIAPAGAIQRVEPAPQPAPMFDASATPHLHAGFALCADVNCPSASIMGIRHAHGPGGRVQVLRDPPAQPAPSPRKRDFHELVDAVGPLPMSAMATSGLQPAPSGDEAKVREIALRWFPGLMDSGMSTALGAVSEAYAAGKADGAREERGYWLRKARSRNVQYVTVEEMEDDQRPGARRVKETK